MDFDKYDDFNVYAFEESEYELIDIEVDVYEIGDNSRNLLLDQHFPLTTQQLPIIHETHDISILASHANWAYFVVSVLIVFVCGRFMLNRQSSVKTHSYLMDIDDTVSVLKGYTNDCLLVTPSWSLLIESLHSNLFIKCNIYEDYIRAESILVLIDALLTHMDARLRSDINIDSGIHIEAKLHDFYSTKEQELIKTYFRQIRDGILKVLYIDDHRYKRENITRLQKSIDIGNVKLSRLFTF